MLGGVSAAELDEETEAAGRLLAETLSLVRQYTTNNKVK
jgi:hypothetical protein